MALVPGPSIGAGLRIAAELEVIRFYTLKIRKWATQSNSVVLAYSPIKNGTFSSQAVHQGFQLRSFGDFQNPLTDSVVFDSQC